MTIKRFDTENMEKSPYYRDVIESYRRAVDVLQNASYIEDYLQAKSWTECEEILLLRLQIDWFDCALSMLQEEEDFYLDDVREKAIYYLNRYYRPQLKSSIVEDKRWRWLMQQENHITNGFFEAYPQGIVPLYPVRQATAASLYKMGSSYVELELPIPVPEGNVGMNVPLQLSIGFRWTEEKMWGEINICVNSEKIVSRNQKHFLTLFRVDLKNLNHSIVENLIVNAYGKFFVSNDFDKMSVIKSFLDNKKLNCTLKLSGPMKFTGI